MRIIIDYNDVTKDLRFDTVGLYDAGSTDVTFRASKISRGYSIWLFKAMCAYFRTLRCPRCHETVFDFFLPNPKETKKNEKANQTYKIPF